MQYHYPNSTKQFMSVMPTSFVGKHKNKEERRNCKCACMHVPFTYKSSTNISHCLLSSLSIQLEGTQKILYDYLLFCSSRYSLSYCYCWCCLLPWHLLHLINDRSLHAMMISLNKYTFMTMYMGSSSDDRIFCYFFGNAFCF